MGQRSEAQIEIAAPPEAVFEWIVDRERMAEWVRDTVEWAPADRSELRVGYRGTEIVQMPSASGPEPTPTEVEVTAYDPPREASFTMSNPALEVRTGYLLEPTEGGTSLRSFTATEYRGEIADLARQAAPTYDLAEMQQEAHERSLERLKELVERDGGGED